jgi:hypothetical protein
MNDYDKKSRCGFVVVRLRSAGDAYFLMRQDRRWKDWNFIGGHEKTEDASNLMKSARRELLEEVPPLRRRNHFDLRPLTGLIEYGPIQSRSSGNRVIYELEFFQLIFNKNPSEVIEALTGRSANRLLKEEDLLLQRGLRTSGLVSVLDRALDGGIRSLDFSWPEDLKLAHFSNGQMEIPFQWRENGQVSKAAKSSSQPPSVASPSSRGNGIGI